MIAQVPDIIAKGAEYGFLGWIIVLVASGAFCIGCFFWLPKWKQMMAQADQRFKMEMERAARDERRQEEEAEGRKRTIDLFGKLVDVANDTHATTGRIEVKIDQHGDHVRALVVAVRANADGLKLVSGKSGGVADEHVGRARAALDVIDQEAGPGEPAPPKTGRFPRPKPPEVKP